MLLAVEEGKERKRGRMMISAAWGLERAAWRRQPLCKRSKLVFKEHEQQHVRRGSTEVCTSPLSQVPCSLLAVLVCDA